MRVPVLTSGILVALLALPLLLVSAPALASTVELAGALDGAPIPPRYDVVGADMVFKSGRAHIEVRAEGDCHYEYHEECHAAGNPPTYICHPVPTWVCLTDYASFALPSTVVLRGKEVYYTADGANLRIGVVKSFLFWSWIKLDPNARLNAGRDHASLIVDVPASAPRADRQEVFTRLHGADPVVELMVRFQGVGNAQARGILKAAGYAGPIAPTNDWSATDLTRNWIGIQVGVRQATSLIARLKSNRRVTDVAPAHLP
jgi:hypothetical protein